MSKDLYEFSFICFKLSLFYILYLVNFFEGMCIEFCSMSLYDSVCIAFCLLNRMTLQLDGLSHDSALLEVSYASDTFLLSE